MLYLIKVKIKMSRVNNYKTLSIIMAIYICVIAAYIIYQNIIVPWPYAEELKECLEVARNYETPVQAEREENICFKIYPVNE